MRNECLNSKYAYSTRLPISRLVASMGDSILMFYSMLFYYFLLDSKRARYWLIYLRLQSVQHNQRNVKCTINEVCPSWYFTSFNDTVLELLNQQHLKDMPWFSSTDKTEMQIPTQRYGRRPYGVGLLVAGYDVSSNLLWQGMLYSASRGIQMVYDWGIQRDIKISCLQNNPETSCQNVLGQGSWAIQLYKKCIIIGFSCICRKWALIFFRHAHRQTTLTAKPWPLVHVRR